VKFVHLVFLSMTLGCASGKVQSAQSKVLRAPNEAGAWIALGDAHWASGDKDAARQAYSTALSQAGELPARVAKRMGMSSGGNAPRLPLEDAVLQDPNNDELWGDLGDAYLAAGRREEAIEAYMRAAQLDPSDSEWRTALSNLGLPPQAYMGSFVGVNPDGTFPNGRLHPQEAQVVSDPTNDEVWGDLGDAYLAAGMEEQAVIAYVRAATLDPSDSEWQRALSNLGQDAMAGAGIVVAGMNDDLLVVSGERHPLEEQAMANLSNDEIWGDLGDLYRNLGRTEDARLAYTKANQLDPGDSEWVSALSRLREVSDITEAELLAMESDEAVGDLSDTLWEGDRRELACKGYLHALQLDSGDSEWWTKTTRCVESEVLSLDSLDPSTLQYDTSNDEAVGNHGDLLWSLGEFKEACDLFGRAKALDPGDGEWTRKIDNCSQQGISVAIPDVESVSDAVALLNGGDREGAIRLVNELVGQGASGGDVLLLGAYLSGTTLIEYMEQHASSVPSAELSSMRLLSAVLVSDWAKVKELMAEVPAGEFDSEILEAIFKAEGLAE